MESIDALAKAVNEYSGGLVLVSHDMRLISQVANEIWICDKKKITKYKGDIVSMREPERIIALIYYLSYLNVVLLYFFPIASLIIFLPLRVSFKLFQMNFKMDLRKAQGIGNENIKLQGDASVKATDKAKKLKVKKPEPKLEVIQPKAVTAPAITTISEEIEEKPKVTVPSSPHPLSSILKPLASDDATVATMETSGSSSTAGNGTGIASTITTSEPSAAAAPAKKKYIPIHLRRKMAAEAAAAEEAAKSK
jgi:energy-coupling factor transporter ATP-binding protein EcfA2